MREANWPREKRKDIDKKERKKLKNIIGVMEEFDHGSLHPSIKHPETDMSRPGYEPRLP
jgi:hypothetical protein